MSKQLVKILLTRRFLRYRNFCAFRASTEQRGTV